jgi:hypothetical protein
MARICCSTAISRAIDSVRRDEAATTAVRQCFRGVVAGYLQVNDIAASNELRGVEVRKR